MTNIKIGYTTIPKDCVYCGKPLNLPRSGSTKRHPECNKIYYLQYYRQASKEATKKLTEQDKIRIRALSRKRAKRARETVLNHYNNKCVCCNESHYEFLAIDHINGNGKEHRKAIGGGGESLYRWLIKNNFPDGYRLLCHNCNMSLGLYGYCPHQKLK